MYDVPSGKSLNWTEPGGWADCSPSSVVRLVVPGNGNYGYVSQTMALDPAVVATWATGNANNYGMLFRCGALSTLGPTRARCTDHLRSNVALCTTPARLVDDATPSHMHLMLPPPNEGCLHITQGHQRQRVLRDQPVGQGLPCAPPPRADRHLHRARHAAAAAPDLPRAAGRRAPRVVGLPWRQRRGQQRPRGLALRLARQGAVRGLARRPHLPYHWRVPRWAASSRCPSRSPAPRMLPGCLIPCVLEGCMASEDRPPPRCCGPASLALLNRMPMFHRAPPATCCRASPCPQAPSTSSGPASRCSPRPATGPSSRCPWTTRRTPSTSSPCAYNAAAQYR